MIGSRGHPDAEDSEQARDQVVSGYVQNLDSPKIKGSPPKIKKEPCDQRRKGNDDAYEIHSSAFCSSTRDTEIAIAMRVRASNYCPTN
jgi:hypothetical protein